MSRPHVDQFDRDALDDRGLIDTGTAGDDETAPEFPVLAHQAGTAPASQKAITTTTIRKATP